MAGGKETPRQKMIGMMYLVLTALLALQVSNTVLDRFVFINQSVEQSVRENVERNSGTVKRVEASVKESGDRKDDRAVLAKAEGIRQKTTEVITYIEELKEKIVEATGGRDKEGNLEGIKNEEVLANMMINQKGGDELKNTLNEFTQFLTQNTSLTFDPLGYDGNDHPYFKNDPNQRKKDFANLNFGQTPMAAGLATLSQFQTEVLSKEAEALEDLARQVGAGDLKFDRIVPMVRQESKVVAAGSKYSAELFIAASSSGVVPEMFINDKSIPVDPSGMGKVEFVARPGTYNEEGISRQTFKADIAIKMPGGKDTVFSQNVEYLVAKPVIQVQSQALSALYYNCANDLSVQVPALGSSYNPSFRASNANTIPGNKKGLVTIVPTSAADVELTVVNDGNTLGVEKFKVKPIPKPNVKLMNRGKEVNTKQGESISGLRSLDIRALAEEGFKQQLPNDARYKVSEWTVTVARGPRPIVPPIKSTSETINLAQALQSAKAGDRLVIEVTKVQRMNFKGQIENVSINDNTFNIPLN